MSPFSVSLRAVEPSAALARAASARARSIAVRSAGANRLTTAATEVGL